MHFYSHPRDYNWVPQQPRRLLLGESLGNRSTVYTTWNLSHLFSPSRLQLVSNPIWIMAEQYEDTYPSLQFDIVSCDPGYRLTHIHQNMPTQ